MRVVDRELAPASPMGAQDAERPVLAVDEDAQAADYAPLHKQRRAAKARVGRQVLHNDRPGGAQRVAGVGVGVGGDDDPARVTPTHAGPQHQRAALRTELQYTAELDLEHPSGEPDGGIHQVPDRGPGEGLLPQVRHRLLLARGRLQRGFGARQPGVARLALRDLAVIFAVSLLVILAFHRIKLPPCRASSWPARCSVPTPSGSSPTYIA